MWERGSPQTFTVSLPEEDPEPNHKSPRFDPVSPIFSFVVVQTNAARHSALHVERVVRNNRRFISRPAFASRTFAFTVKPFFAGDRKNALCRKCARRLAAFLYRPAAACRRDARFAASEVSSGSDNFNSNIF